MNACTNEQLFSTPIVASDSGPLKLDYLSDRQIVSLNNVLQLVKDRAVCVSESNDEVNFWWNEKYLDGKLQEGYKDYFAGLQQSDPNFRVCVVN